MPRPSEPCVQRDSAIVSYNNDLVNTRCIICHEDVSRQSRRQREANIEGGFRIAQPGLQGNLAHASALKLSQSSLHHVGGPSNSL